MTERVERPSPLWGDRRIPTHGFEPKWSQTNDIYICIFHFPARHSALLGYDKYWLAQCLDNMTEWDIMSRHPGVPVRQHHKISMVDLRCCQDVKLQHPNSLSSVIGTYILKSCLNSPFLYTTSVARRKHRNTHKYCSSNSDGSSLVSALCHTGNSVWRKRA